MAARLGGLWQYKATRLLTLCVVLSFIYFYYESAYQRTFSRENETFLHSDKLEKLATKLKNNIFGTTRDPPNTSIDVIITFTNAKNNHNLQEKFRICVASMLEYASVRLKFHILGDEDSQNIAERILSESGGKSPKATFQLQKHDIDKMIRVMHDITQPLRQYFGYKPGAGNYYGDALFFLSIGIHRVMADEVETAIMLDSDLKFQTDIKHLFKHFDAFTEDNVIGIAREMQPVYRHTFYQYRSKNPGTRVGSPGPDGLTGFNSGVLLLNLDKMRSSKLYNSLIDETKVKHLAEKFKFQGHLGDQDFFTLLNLDHEELFYLLPCTWNRQLCQWWRDKGYDDVFDQYYSCEGHINIYHGNCNTDIP